MLDRSRSSTSGRAAMRGSIVGVAVKFVTRWRSIDIDNQCGVELFEHHQIGRRPAGRSAARSRWCDTSAPGTRMVCGCGRRRPVRQERLRTDSGVHMRRRQREDHLGQRRWIRCCRCRWRWAKPRPAAGSADSPAARRVELRQRLVRRRTTAGSITSQHPVPLPVGQVPAHRDRDRADLPAAQRGQHELLGVRNRQCDKRTELRRRRPASARPHWLARPSSSRESQRLRVAVARDDGQSRVVAALFGELRAAWSPNGIPSSADWASPRPAGWVLTPIPGPREQCLERAAADVGQQAQGEHLGAQRQPHQRLGVPVEHADVGLVAEAQGSEQLVRRRASPVVRCRRP